MRAMTDRPRSNPGVSPTAPGAALPELTSLRFIAALAVVVLHYRDLLGPLPEPLLRAIVGGQFGVTFFFVLSGFILTYRYRDWFAGGVAAGDYWKFQRFRWVRLYPVYVVGLLLDTPWHLVERAQAGQLAAEAQTFAASWVVNLLGLQAWVPKVPYAMFWNTPAWSVAAEFFFYAVFPWVCAALARQGQRQGRLAVILVATVAGGSLLYAAVICAMNRLWHVDAQTQYLVTVYNPLLRFSEFLAGCVAGHGWLLLRSRASGRGGASALLGSEAGRNTVICVCLLAVAARIAMPGYTGPSFGLWLLDGSVKYAAFVLPFVGLIVAVACGRTWLSPLLERPTMVMLGEASYSLYIIHWSVVTVLHLKLLGPWSTPPAHAALFVATVALSVLCWRVVEVPWRRLLRGPRGRPSRNIARPVRLPDAPRGEAPLPHLKPH
jgi:peptidoglycan/LPS O-acetylase OafA/YrhL